METNSDLTFDRYNPTFDNKEVSILKLSGVFVNFEQTNPDGTIGVIGIPEEFAQTYSNMNKAAKIIFSSENTDAA